MHAVNEKKKEKEERGRKTCTHLKKERKIRKTIERNRFSYPNLKKKRWKKSQLKKKSIEEDDKKFAEKRKRWKGKPEIFKKWLTLWALLHGP